MGKYIQLLTKFDLSLYRRIKELYKVYKILILGILITLDILLLMEVCNEGKSLVVFRNVEALPDELHTEKIVEIAIRVILQVSFINFYYLKTCHICTLTVKLRDTQFCHTVLQKLINK